ncbi:Cytochrome c6 [Enhygromyxa salina]|uniref:Cytochrome c6 n=1 Tax=Enhygromyxa salina TaxID=215803 RepID=A0A2S9YH38_9BACT|nr:cytochrome c [Enhygromyxa salina]PRQ04417.1 Cytochrome c6 [Enhygromyxa salina]
MYRRALQSLFVAATALLLTTTACDAGGEAKADVGKKTSDKAADEGKAADDGKAEGEAAAGAEAGAEVAAEAGAEPAAEAGAEPAAETGGDATGDAPGETGEAAPAAAEGDGGDKPADGGASEKKPADDGDKAAAGPKIDGKPLFEKKCKSCHGIDGKGDTTIGKKVDMPSLVKTKLSKAKIVALITDGVPDTKMKAFKTKLSKDEIDAVAAYVKKL